MELASSAFDLDAERLAGADEVLLAEELVEGAGTQCARRGERRQGQRPFDPGAGRRGYGWIRFCYSAWAVLWRAAS